MKINNKQLESLENIYVPQQIKRLSDRVRFEFPDESSKFSATDLDTIVKNCLKSSKDLGIESEDLQYKLLRLNFLESQFIAHPFVQKVLALVLMNTQATGQARINFIEKNVLSRQQELMSYLN